MFTIGYSVISIFWAFAVKFEPIISQIVLFCDGVDLMKLMPIKTKELIMKYCGAYAEYKKGKLTDNMTLVKTRILNDRNGDVLGEYNSLRGFIFK